MSDRLEETPPPRRRPAMTCLRCGLPDPYQGQGDGFGSCECSRCDCCRAAPEECDCSQDWDGYEDEFPGDPNGGEDWLCNDTSCYHRQARVEARAQAGVGQVGPVAESGAGDG